MGCLNGLAFLHLELTSRCNKNCFMCGRRKMEKDYSELCNWGDMPFEMAEIVRDQVPSGIVVQFHNNGEPLLYPDLGHALSIFYGNIRCLDTNGKLLMERADDLVGNLETLTISVIQDDPEGDEQYEIVQKFLEKKGVRKPYMVYRLLGRIRDKERWEKLPGKVVKRVLHSPEGSFNYEKEPVVHEVGFCIELLTHLTINRFGHVSVCVRFDPEGHLIIGDINKNTLEDIWYGKVRKHYLDCHLQGHRDWLKGCDRCEYWGVPRG